MSRARSAAGLLLLLAFSGSGCYLSSIPLSPPSRGLDGRLFGLWRCVPNEPSNEEARLKIVPFDEHQYYADWTDGDDVTRYRAYATLISSTTILNVQELKETEAGDWMFLRYVLPDADHLTLSVVRDTMVQAPNERAALDIVRRGAAGAELFGPAVALCTRQRVTEP